MKIIPIEIYNELLKIRVLLDENLPKGKQELTNFLKSFIEDAMKNE